MIGLTISLGHMMLRISAHDFSCQDPLLAVINHDCTMHYLSL